MVVDHNEKPGDYAMHNLMKKCLPYALGAAVVLGTVFALVEMVIQ